MCLTLTVHITKCETRRRVIVNPLTGLTIFHPLENPGPCAHSGLAGEASCPSHGPCCVYQQWQTCLCHNLPCQGWQTYHLVYSVEQGIPPALQLGPPSFPTKLNAPRPEDLLAVTLRKDFYDIGAEIWRCVSSGEMVISNFDAYLQQPNGNLLQETDHSQVHRSWQEAVTKLALLTELWEYGAGNKEIEPCPATNMDTNGYLPFLQICKEIPAGFPMLDATRSFAVPDIDLIELFTPSAPRDSEEERYPEALALSPTTEESYPEALALSPTAEEMPISQESILRAEIEIMKERVAALEAQRPYAEKPDPFLPNLNKP